LTITLQSGPKITIPNEQLVIPDVHLDKDGGMYFDPETREVLLNPLQGKYKNSLPTLGAPFFTSAYLHVNYDTDTFNLWQANPTTEEKLVGVRKAETSCQVTPASVSGAASDSNSDSIFGTAGASESNSSSLSTSSYVGIGVGVIAAAAIAIAAFIQLRRRRRNCTARNSQSSGRIYHKAELHSESVILSPKRQLDLQNERFSLSPKSQLEMYNDSPASISPIQSQQWTEHHRPLMQSVYELPGDHPHESQDLGSRVTSTA
jgi:hypothetical protein